MLEERGGAPSPSNAIPQIGAAPHLPARARPGIGAPADGPLGSQRIRRGTRARGNGGKTRRDRKPANLGCPETVVGGDPMPSTGYRGASCHAARVQELHHGTHHLLPEDLHRVASGAPPHVPFPPFPPLSRPLTPLPLLSRALPPPLRHGSGRARLGQAPVTASDASEQWSEE